MTGKHRDRHIVHRVTASARTRLLRLGAALLAACSGAALVVACSTNPATGQRQLSLVGEGQEIAMGREADPQIVAQFGLYPDEGLQRYVSDIGQALARASERPDLPWTFRVLDDPLVNAFALPGGFIYITRGILAHLDSEAELAGVLGHEIGHVTARHSASQMSKGMLAQIGLVAGAVLAPEAAQDYGGLAQAAAGLMFLKFGRDDERQADALGVRYASREGYDPNALLGVFDTLDRVSQAAGGGMPGWASTHPAPEDRSQRISALISELGSELPSDLRREREPYLRRLDGLVYGDDPRQGFFDASTFYHPELAFELRFPDGWATQNTRNAVMALHPQRVAMVQLTLANAPSASDAASRFYGQEAVVAGQRWNDPVAGLRSVGGSFGVRDASGQIPIEGFAVFAEHGGRVYQLLGYARSNAFGGVSNALRSSLSSMRQLRDQRILAAQPLRLDVMQLDRRRTLAQVAQGSPVSVEALGMMNRVSPDGTLEPGSWIKVVRGTLPMGR
ncbi:MAG TPA: M48 family metalloprotease [Thermoanaerobaculia bacterium]|nr:M48 family metalloprotease [Thermoanaerobaculia bacterium]